MWAMIMPIVTALLPFAIKLITYFIDKKLNDQELKKKFLELLNTRRDDLPISIREKYLKQIEDIKREILEEEKGKNGQN